MEEERWREEWRSDRVGSRSGGGGLKLTVLARGEDGLQTEDDSVSAAPVSVLSRSAYLCELVVGRVGGSDEDCVYFVVVEDLVELGDDFGSGEEVPRVRLVRRRLALEDRVQRKVLRQRQDERNVEHAAHE